MTNGIKVTPDVLEDIARSIDSRSRSIETAIGSVNRIIGQINTSRFQGVRADFFRTNYRSRYDRIRSFAKVLWSFSIQLNAISHQFRLADNLLSGSQSYREQLARLPGLRGYVIGKGLFGIGIIGGLGIISLPWLFRPPSWWPFRPRPIPGPKPEPGPVPLPVPQPVPPHLPLDDFSEFFRKKLENESNARELTSPTLKEVTGAGSSYTCATYARARRPDLGATEHPKYSAYNYKNKFPDQTFQLENHNGNLQEVIGVGYAVVWEPAHTRADNTHGHVAIVEAVYQDHIVISEAVRDSNGVYYITQNTISLEELNNNHVWLVS